MKLFGLNITREKALDYSPVVPGSGGWWPLIRESFTQAWQRNIEVNVNTVLTHSTVFACISLISSDIAKLRIRLVAEDDDGIWTEVRANSPFWSVLRKPNRYQTSIQFFANWVESKLIHGNTYILKERDNRGGPARDVGVVKGLYILDPLRVTVLCSPDGTIAYELRGDYLSGVPDETIRVPASEIIHDRWNTFYHPLIGTSPITAAGLSATQGLNIQKNAAKFFAAGSHPGGLLSTAANISRSSADEIREKWNATYGPNGTGVGSVAVLGNGFSYQPLTITAVDSQLIEQLKLTSEIICSVFHVPGHMVGIGPPPAYNNIEALNQAYYSQCLQAHIENIEKLLDEGLELPRPLGTEFDLEGLLRMDTASRVKAASEAIRSAAMSPDEARKRWLDLGPVPGGDTPYMQQQNYSLAALAERDSDNPFSKPAPGPVGTAPDVEGTPENGGDGNIEDDDNTAIERGFSEGVEWPKGTGNWYFSQEELEKAQCSALARSFNSGARQLEYRPDS